MRQATLSVTSSYSQKNSEFKKVNAHFASRYESTYEDFETFTKATTITSPMDIEAQSLLPQHNPAES